MAGEPARTRTLSEADFAVPPGDRYFEDYLPGSFVPYFATSLSVLDGVAEADCCRRFDQAGAALAANHGCWVARSEWEAA